MLVLARSSLGVFPDATYFALHVLLGLGAFTLVLQLWRGRRQAATQAPGSAWAWALEAAWLATLPAWLVGQAAWDCWDRVSALRAALGPLGPDRDAACLGTLYLVWWGLITAALAVLRARRGGLGLPCLLLRGWGAPRPRRARALTLLGVSLLLGGSLLAKPAWRAWDERYEVFEAQHRGEGLDPWGRPWITEGVWTYSCGPNGTQESLARFGAAVELGDDVFVSRTLPPAQGGGQVLDSAGLRYHRTGWALAALAALLALSYVLARLLPRGATGLSEAGRIAGLCLPLAGGGAGLGNLLLLGELTRFMWGEALVHSALGLACVAPGLWGLVAFRGARWRAAQLSSEAASRRPRERPLA